MHAAPVRVIAAAVRRPVAFLAATGAFALLGATSLARMPLELLPDVTFPRLEVRIVWPGASPEMVEAFVTAPIEAAAEAARDVRSVGSTSYAQRARVTIEFDRGADMRLARLDLAERLAVIARTLPPGAGRPVIEPFVPQEFSSETDALVAYTLAGPRSSGVLRELAMNEVRPRLRAVEGVGAVVVEGGSERVLRVDLDGALLAARGLSPVDVRRAIENGLDVSDSGARVRGTGLELAVAIERRVRSVGDMRALVIRPAEPGRGPAVRLEEVGEVRLAPDDPMSVFRVDGQPAVSLFVHHQAGSNAIAIAERVAARIARIPLPPGHRLILDYDGTERIRSELADLGLRAGLAAAVVLVVLLASFRRWRPALLAFATIILSALVALDFLRLGGLSLNLLTVAGLSMGFGFIVDNAIVVLDSIERHRDEGWDSGAAAELGARRVLLPILAASATNAIVFLPFLYLQGELRAYYVPFAFTVGLVLAASLIVSFTLVPALAARIPERGAGIARGIEAGGRAAGRSRPYGRALHGRVCLTGRAADTYERALTAALAHSRGVVAFAFILLAASAWLFLENVPRGRAWSAWTDDTYLSMRVTMPRGTVLEQTDEIARRLEAKVATYSQIERYETRVAGEHATIRVTFPDSLEASWVPPAVKEELVAYSQRLGGAEVQVYGFGPSFYGGSGSPPAYSLDLRGYGYRELERLASDLAQRLRRFPRIRDVDPNAGGPWFERDKELEFLLAPQRERLSAYGISMVEFFDQVTTAVDGVIARGEATVGEERLGLAVRLSASEEATLEDLADLVLTTKDGRPVRVSEVASIRQRETMARVIRQDQQYQRIVAYEFRGPAKLGGRVRDAVVAATALPSGYSLIKERPWWEYGEGEASQLVLVVILALALVYMVTAALYESLLAPLVVLAAVPLALIGVFVVYFYTGWTFTREAWIGVVMMAGIVVNNAILVVDRIGSLHRGDDHSPFGVSEAALQGTLERVRPVLISSATTVFGLLPLVLLVEEEGSNLWQALAVTTIGGLVASTLFVLTVIPALYTLLVGGDRKAVSRACEGAGAPGCAAR